MTSKIQNIAMFAIAAFALGGMVVAPAYAASTPINTAVTATSDTADSGYTQKGCGFGMDCNAKVRSSSSVNWVKAYYGALDGGSCASVHVEAWVNGNQVIDTIRSNVSGSGNFIKANTAVDSGDSITSTSTFVDCI